MQALVMHDTVYIRYPGEPHWSRQRGQRGEGVRGGRYFPTAELAESVEQDQKE